MLSSTMYEENKSERCHQHSRIPTKSNLALSIRTKPYCLPSKGKPAKVWVYGKSVEISLQADESRVPENLQEKSVAFEPFELDIFERLFESKYPEKDNTNKDLLAKLPFLKSASRKTSTFPLLPVGSK